MAGDTTSRNALRTARTATTLAALSAALMLGACAQADGPPEASLLSSTETGSNPTDKAAEAGKTDLEKATEYWGKEFAKKSRDLNTGLSYARNLKAMGRKQEAFGVLQQLALFHGQNRDLASEYGRLALDLGQVQIAANVLQMADDPSAPDWRVISARGTVLAKQGKYSEAIPFYERALQASPNQRSVMNNLALAYTMNGEAQKAEGILRQADPDGSDPKIKSNLALVMSLQGRHDEAKQMAANGPSPGRTSDDVDTLRQIVRADQRPAAAPARHDQGPALRGPAAEQAIASAGGWRTVVAEGR